MNDEIKMGILNMAKRDTIEQVVFDPQLGIVKREIHYGIIDYLTVCSYIHHNFTIDLPHEEKTRGDYPQK